jgi:hypothetical protein
MKELLKNFFDANPDATEVHVALGFMCSTIEEAAAKLAGVHGHQVETFNRDNVMIGEVLIGSKEIKANDDLKAQVSQFKKRSVDKMKKGIESLEGTIAKKVASLPSEVDQEKATKSISFLESLILEMKSVLDEAQKK